MSFKNTSPTAKAPKSAQITSEPTQGRVQKILAQAGIASRRKSEELIQEGLVTINGKVAKLGDKAEWGKDAIKVKGKLLLKPETLTYLAFFKPKGVICVWNDPEGRPSLETFLGSIKTRVFPVGRLDFNSEGLILLTNDGNLAEQVQKRDDIARVYAVKVKGHLDEEMLSRLKKGAKMGKPARPAEPGTKPVLQTPKVGMGGHMRLFKPHEVTLQQELANKTVVQVVVLGHGAFDLKAYFELKGFLVEKITRTAFGHMTLRGIEPGKFKVLKPSQAMALLAQPELGMKAIDSTSVPFRALKRAEEREARELRGAPAVVISGNPGTKGKAKVGVVVRERSHSERPRSEHSRERTRERIKERR